MNSTTIKDLLIALDKSPWDESLLGILADTYEEEGNPLHLGIRHMIQNNKYPGFWQKLGLQEVGPKADWEEVCWFNISRVDDSYKKDRDVLESSIFYSLENSSELENLWDWKNSIAFPDTSSAILAYTNAFLKLSSPNSKTTPLNLS